ncbi:hypothetical protein AB0I98_48265, partial [Streptomyces sp. NPDC050211]
HEKARAAAADRLAARPLPGHTARAGAHGQGGSGARAASPGGAEPADRPAAARAPGARLVLLSSLAEADAPPHENDRRAVSRGLESGPAPGHGTGYEVSCGPVRPAGRTGAGDPEPEDPELCPPRNEPPSALIRLRFADAAALERAGAAFRAGSGPGFGDAWGDPATLTLHIPGDAGIETLRAVLAVLDAAALTAESLTVHTRELDDVFAAFTGLP